MKKLLLITGLTLISVFARGQILAWDFFSNTSTATSYNSTYNYPDVDASVLTRGSGAGAGGGYSYGFSIRFVESANSYENAKANNAYVEFKVKSASAYLSLEGIDVKLRSHSLGATKYRWAYKRPEDADFVPLGTADGNFPAYDSANDTGIPQPTLELSSVSALQGIPANTEVIFRLYGWGGVGTTGNNTSAIGKSSSAQGSISLMLRGVSTSSPISLSTDKQIVSWQWAALGASTTNPIADPVSATNYDANLSSYTLSRGAGLTAAAYQRAFASTLAATSTSLADAEAANEYYQITLSSNSGYYKTLSSLLYRIRRTAAGPTSYQWKYSIDGEPEVNIGTSGTFPAPAAGSDGVDMYLDLQGINALKNIPSNKNITLKIYIWGNASTAAAFGFGRFTHNTTDFSSLYLRGIVSATLPITLTSFKATKQTNSVRLNWYTSAENGNSHFEVLRAGDDQKFLSIGKVNGSGTTSTAKGYALTDYKPLLGGNYYKLVQTDINGDFKEVGDVQHVQFNFSKTSLTVLQQEDQSTVKALLTIDKADQANVLVYNVSGNALYQGQATFNSGVNEILLPIHLNRGMYILKVKTQSGAIWQTKFVR